VNILAFLALPAGIRARPHSYFKGYIGMHTKRIGFIGPGIMGKPMMHNLQRAGFSLSVYARRQAQLDELGLANVQSYASPSELASAVDIIISCVSDSSDVEEVLTGPSGVIHGIRPGALVIDMSTISAEVTKRLANQLEAKQASLLDAPVSGGEIGAINGTLSIMVGGSTIDFTRAQAVFAAMGSNIVHIGDNGAGQIAKACNQILAAQTMNAVAEAYLLAQSADVDPAKVREALLGGFAYSRVLELHGQRMLEQNYEPGFKTHLHAKDLGIALDSAKANQIDLPGAILASELLQKLLEQGDGELDSAAIAKIVGSG